MMGDTLTSYAELADILEGLPLLVREGRRSRRLNLRDAGEQSGVGFNTLSRVERGMGCSLLNAVAILRWLDQPADGEQTPRRNVHCSRCGDTRGGPAGHETSECTWRNRG